MTKVHATQNTQKNTRLSSLIALTSAALAATAILASTNTQADTIRSGQSKTLVLDDPEDGATLWRSDRARTGNITKLPTSFQQLWKAKIRGGVDRSPVVTNNDEVIVVSGHEMIELDREGKESRRVRLPDQPTQEPYINSRQDRLVVTNKNELHAFTSKGSKRYTTQLPNGPYSLRGLPTQDGGYVLISTAIYPMLVHVDIDGAIIASVRLPHRPMSDLMAWGDNYYAISDAGHVMRWRPTEAVEDLGPILPNGAGSASIATMLDQNTIAVLAGSRELVTFDVSTKKSRTLIASTAAGWDTELCANDESIFLLSGGNLVVEFSRSGKEKSRTVLDPSVTSAIDAGGPPIIVSNDGQMLFARSNSAGVARRGRVTASTDKAPCSDPTYVTAHAGRVIVTCVDGLMVALGDK